MMKGKEKVPTEKFRKFWMESVAEEFKDDLDPQRVFIILSLYSIVNTI